MFLLAGAASWLALGARSAGRYATLRVQRLAIPLVLGIILLSPFEAWVGATSHGSAASFPAFALSFFADMRFYPNPRWLGDYGYHLWFLGFLFLYAIVSVPAMVWLRGANREALTAAPRRLTGRLGLAWPMLPLLISQVPLRVAFPQYRDWADFTLWFVYFWLGVLLVAERQLLTRITERGLWMIGPGFVLALAFVPIALAGKLWSLEGAPQLDAPGLAYLALRTTLGWCWVAVALAVGIRWLDRGAALARRAGEAVLPFYVLHHPIVVVVAAAVVPWSTGVWAKFAVITLTSLLLTVLVCEGIVRRSAAMRGIFGLTAARATPAFSEGGI
jgi:hypothetical protein